VSAEFTIFNGYRYGYVESFTSVINVAFYAAGCKTGVTVLC